MWLMACALVAPSLQQERYDTPLNPARTWDLPRDSLDDRLLDVCQTRNKTTAADAQAAIDAGGSSLRDHRQVSGELGYFQHAWRVYGREDEPCRTCQRPVERIVQSNRSTFFCAACQR